jgi:CRISPR-associated protein Cmr1
MQTLEYTVRFNTPAFLGNAEQNAQWRTPPFKALLRQWWRVAYAAENQFMVNVAEMRTAEGELFGVAADGGDSQKSQIRLRLNTSQGEAWAMGSQSGVIPLPTNLNTSYAWFGLINRGNNLPNRAGIKAASPTESVRQLSLAFPDTQKKRMQEVMALIHAFGLLGSRSRGGWGALHIDNEKELTNQGMEPYTREIDGCLNSDWPISLAKDTNGLLMWESKNTFKSWDAAMEFIATQRKTVRTALKNGKDLRPALGFALPNGRMPSPLRWKVMAPQQGNLTVRAFAMPHKIPDSAEKSLSLQDLLSAWSAVTKTLDSIHAFQRLTERNKQ